MSDSAELAALEGLLHHPGWALVHRRLVELREERVRKLTSATSLTDHATMVQAAGEARGLERSYGMPEQLIEELRSHLA